MVLWDIHNGLLSENNNSRKRAKTESEAGHFMNYKENKLYYFIQLELLCRKNLTKIFGEVLRESRSLPFELIIVDSLTVNVIG